MIGILPPAAGEFVAFHGQTARAGWGTMRRTQTVHTRHQSLEIWQSEWATEFRVAGAVHASYHRRRFLTGLAWDMIAAGALLGANDPPRSVLMLGLAGGTAFRVLRHLLPDCRLTAIDIDPEIIGLARTHMALDALGIEVVRDAFPVVRSLKSAAAMNEVLVAGEHVATRSRLAGYAEAFADWRDRDYWERLELRRLS